MMTGKRQMVIARAPLRGLLALVAAVMLTASSASARYMFDGGVQNGTTGGWNLPTDFVCVVGLHADGTMDVADGVTSSRDCIYLQKGTMNGGTPFDLTGMTTSAACATAGGAGNDGAAHSWATSWCSKSLTGLDRTQQMCVAIGGTWVTSGKCVAYGRQFRGQDASGAPLAFGTKGTTQGAGTGYCYAVLNMTTAYTSTPCPSNQAVSAPFDANAAYDWSVGPETTRGPKCQAGMCCYAKGIAGYLPSNLTKVDGTITPAGTFVDFSLLTTMGECLAAGGSWNNWTGQGASLPVSVATTPLASTIPGWDYQKQSPDADEGCLHCHSTTVEYNGPAERFKDSYLLTGHKNMLRKVTAGKNWAGPDANGVLQIYTAYAAGTLNFTTATAQVSGVDKPLLYIFGDWMAPAPAGLDVIVNMSGSAKYNGVSNYSCAPCHSTGWADNTGTIGLCSPQSSKTTQAACTAVPGNTWYPAIGVKGIGNAGYTPQEPAASFPGVTFTGAGKWDIEGITCARCHNAAVGPVNAAMIAASPYKTTYPTSGGMGNIPGGPDAAGEYATFLCYGCHQSIAKTNNGVGLDNDLAHPEALPVKNAVTTGACADTTKTSESACQGAGSIWTPTFYVPMFNGHVIGGSFLGSVHAEATTTIVPNALGKYNLVTDLACTGAGVPYACCTGAGAGTCSTYGSTFTGYTCWQSSSSSSPALTWIDGSLTTQSACEAAEGEWETAGCVREIKDKTKCESLYGAGAWRAPANGSCSTCHDIHNSLFVAGQEERALRKKCENCHVDNASTSATVASAPQIDPLKMRHLQGPATPFDPTVGESPCVVCHMPKPTSGDFPMHVWRINPDENYDTFPTAAQFGAGTVPTQKVANTAPDGTYTNAVWVGLDEACGQCHGGSERPVTTGSITAGSKTLTVVDATNIEAGKAVTVAGAGPSGADLNSAVVSVVGTTVTLVTAANTTVTNAGVSPHTAVAIHIPKAELAKRAEGIHTNNLVVSFGYSISSPNTLQITAFASADCSGPCTSYSWDWGDGGTGSGATATHAYAAAGTYNVTLTVTGSAGSTGSVTRKVTVYQPDFGPTAAGTACGSILSTTTWDATLVDASTDSATGGNQISVVTVSWGDGSLLATGAAGTTFTHTYKGPGTYNVVQKAVDNIGQQNIRRCAVTVAYYTIGGTVTAVDTTIVPAPPAAPVSSATVQIVNAVTNAVARRVSTSGSGAYLAGSLRPGSYNVVVTKGGYTFPVLGPITVGPSSPSGNDVVGTIP